MYFELPPIYILRAVMYNSVNIVVFLEHCSQHVINWPKFLLSASNENESPFFIYGIEE